MKWITRERPKIDRIACPWLVARFIDPSPEFLYVPPADVMKIAARRIWDRMRASHMEGKIILAVHDELVMVCPDHEVGVLREIIEEEAPNVVQWQIPL